MTIFLKIDSTADRERQLIICMIILCYYILWDYIIQIIINTQVHVPFKMRILASWFTVPFKMRILAFWFTRSNMWSSIPVIDYHEFHHILGNSEQAADLIACWRSGLHRLLPLEAIWICEIIIKQKWVTTGTVSLLADMTNYWQMALACISWMGYLNVLVTLSNSHLSHTLTQILNNP